MTYPLTYRTCGKAGFRLWQSERRSLFSVHRESCPADCCLREQGRAADCRRHGWRGSFEFLRLPSAPGHRKDFPAERNILAGAVCPPEAGLLSLCHTRYRCFAQIPCIDLLQRFVRKEEKALLKMERNPGKEDSSQRSAWKETFLSAHCHLQC